MLGAIDRRYVSAITLRRQEVEDFGRYPFSIPALRKLKRLEFHPAVTFFVGENGMGKSTLIEAIAVKMGFNPEGGSRNFRFDTRASHSDLHKYLAIEKGVARPTDGYFLRAESFYNVATEIERLDEEPGGGPLITPSYGGKSLHEQSHGESFFSLLLNRLSGNGLYIFDETEAALSPQRQMSALTLIHMLVQKKSQLIISTHSPILMAYPNAQIYLLTERGIKKIAYTETEHFQVTQAFLNRHQQMLKVLLEDEQQSELPIEENRGKEF